MAMSKVMTVELQRHVIEKLIRKRYGNASNVDELVERALEMIDSTLHLDENIKEIERVLGITLTKASDEIKQNHASDEYVSQKNDELLEEYLMQFGNIDSDEEIQNPEEAIEEELRLLEEEKQIHEQELHRLFDKLRQRRDPIDYLSKYLFPELQGDQYEPVRRAVLLSLVSHRDHRKRNRIHVLVHGMPGCGKTEILLWLRDKMGAVFTTKHTSEVGLIGDARGKELEPGALAEADGNLLCIDELDKFKRKDLDGLLEAMEEGQYTVRKGKIKEKVRAEVRIIASANEIDKLPKALIDRFDFVYELKVLPREERAEKSEKLVEQFFYESETNTEILKAYLDWIADFQPIPENIDRIKKVIREYIKTTNLNLDVYSYRSLELSILRIAYAMAKLRRENVTPLTIVQAIRMKDPTLNNGQTKYLQAIAKGAIDL